WTEENKNILVECYNNFIPDNAIAKRFNGSVYAVARQRCNMGLVKFKRRTYTNNYKEATLDNVPAEFVIQYVRDGVKHFCHTTTTDEQKVEVIVKHLAYNQKDIKNI